MLAIFLVTFPFFALIAAGAISFADGIRLVRERGRLMQEACDAHPGTMAVVLGLQREQVAALCAEHGASLCNENAPGNISIGGTAEAVQATGFVRGEVNRWPELQELAIGNDELLRHPRAWLRVAPGDKLSGDSRLAFFVRGIAQHDPGREDPEEQGRRDLAVLAWLRWRWCDPRP